MSGIPFGVPPQSLEAVLPLAGDFEWGYNSPTGTWASFDVVDIWVVFRPVNTEWHATIVDDLATWSVPESDVQALRNVVGLKVELYCEVTGGDQTVIARGPVEFR